jgi:peroxiredoxin Q/BCP
MAPARDHVDMTKLTEGDVAPPFRLADQDGKTISLGDYAGRRVVVYFYPRDDTPGCTKEACQFSDQISEYASAGVDVVGISPDSAEKHQKFRAKYDLGIRLGSDPDHAVMEAYGAFGEKTLYGRKSVGVIRSTFLVGGNGRIERAWYHVRADGHAAKVLEVVQG